MYRIAAVLVGLQNVVAGLFWIFDPMAILVLWGIKNPSQLLMVERRLGVVLVAIGVILVMSRNAGPSPARSAISYGAIVGSLALIMVGGQDMLYRSASSGIAPGIAFNLFVALAFVLIEWHAHRTSKKTTNT